MTEFTIFILFIISLWMPSYISLFAFPPTELNALEQLYDETNGNDWLWRDEAREGVRWNFSTLNPNPCTENWQGITCTSDCVHVSCSVEKLHLSGYNLRNHLPDIFYDFPSLTRINISINHIYGTLPKSLRSLKTLLVLDVSDNKFEGPLPFGKELNFVHLEAFHGDVNNFNGTLHKNVSNLINLRSLTLGNNKIVGVFPRTLCRLQRLEQLELQANEFLAGTIPSCGKFKFWICRLIIFMENYP